MVLEACWKKCLPCLAGGVWLAVVGGCSGEIDPDDELGVEEDGGYELAVVEGPEGKDQPSPVIPDGTAAEEIHPIVYDPQGEFTVQVGVYRDSQSASKTVHQLSEAGYPAYAVAGPHNKGVRVRIGYFTTRNEAQRFGELIKADRNLDFWVDRRANEE